MYTLFFNFYPINNISILDIYLFYYVIIHIGHFKNVEKPILFTILVLLSSFLVAGVFSIQESYFGVSQYLLNSLRILFYCVVYFIVSETTKKGNFTLIKNLRASLTVLLFLVVVEQVIQFLGVYWSYTIPGITTNTGSKFAPFRPSGTFDEPSYLAVYLGLVYFILQEANVADKYWRLLIFILLVLSRSLTGFLILPVLMLIEFRKYGFWRRRLPLFVILGGLLIIIGSSLLGERILGALSDASLTHRLAGSWEVFSYLWNEKFWTGLGLGQWLNWLNEEGESSESFFFMKGYSRGSGINNVLLMNYGSAGVIGLFATIYFGLRVNRGLKFQSILLWIYFSWGYFFHPMIFLFFGIINGLKELNSRHNRT